LPEDLGIVRFLSLLAAIAKSYNLYCKKKHQKFVIKIYIVIDLKLKLKLKDIKKALYKVINSSSKPKISFAMSTF